MPFIVGAEIIDPGQYFGYWAKLDEFKARISATRFFMIVGARKTGKTGFVVHRVWPYLRTLNYAIVEIDLWRHFKTKDEVKNILELLGLMNEAIYALYAELVSTNWQGKIRVYLDKISKWIGRTVATTLDRIEQFEVEYQKIKISLQLRPPERPSDELVIQMIRRIFRNFRILVERAKEKGLTIALWIDELTHLNKIIGSEDRRRNMLRVLVEGFEDSGALIIVSGSLGFHSLSTGSELAKFFPIELGELAIDEAHQLLRENAAGECFKFTSEALKEIVKQVGRHPLYLQAIGLTAKRNAERRQSENIETIDVSIERMLQEPTLRNVFQYRWNSYTRRCQQVFKLLIHKPGLEPSQIASITRMNPTLVEKYIQKLMDAHEISTSREPLDRFFVKYLKNFAVMPSVRRR